MKLDFWVYIGLGIFCVLVILIPMAILIWRKWRKGRKEVQLDEKLELLTGKWRKRNSEQADLEFLERCAKKQNQALKLPPLKHVDLNVTSEIDKKFVKPTMNPCGIIAAKPQEPARASTKSITESDHEFATYAIRRRSSLPNSLCSQLLQTTDDSIWKSQNLDAVRALDEVFMADFGSNLGYRVELLSAGAANLYSRNDSVSADSITSSEITLETQPEKRKSVILTNEEVQSIDCDYFMKLPAEINSQDIPCAGLIVAELDIQWPKVNSRTPLSKYATHCKYDQIVLKIIVYEVHCILALGFGQHHLKKNEGPSQFYIKARLIRPGSKDLTGKSSGSMWSLDQFAGTFSGSNQMIMGHTPIRRAFRTITFKHCINLPIPLHWMDYNNSGGSLPLDLRLRLDLKECLMHPDQPTSWSHLFKNRNIIASAEINMNSQLWKFFQRREILSIDTVEESKVSMQERKESVRLVFAKPLIPRNKEGSIFCVGQLNLAIQIKIDQMQLSLRLLTAEIHTMPKGVKQVFARCTLTSNYSIIRSFDTNKSNNTSPFAEIEFGLDNLTTISMNPDLNHREAFTNSSICTSSSTEESTVHVNELCLVIILMAKLRAHTPSVVLGRCVIGGPSLAYGSGLKHWMEACKREKELVRGTHSLF